MSPAARQLDFAPEAANVMLLVDGHNILFRAFSSVPVAIADGQGRPVNGVYGLLATLLRLIKDRRPRYLGVAFDVPDVPTFRHELFPAYQGQRGPLGGEAAENFAWQVEQAKRVLAHVGLTWLTAPGFEADDILSTLASMASGRRIPSVIVSSDRDLQCLAGPLVRILIPGKKAIEIGPREVRERLGIAPERILDWKVLAGDPSDNVPGVAGIGDKSAVALVEEFGSWQAVYANLDRVTPRQRTALEKGRPQAELFSQVVRIRRDLNLDVDCEDLIVDYARLPTTSGEALRQLGLRPPLEPEDDE